MNKDPKDKNLWHGLTQAARRQLRERQYSKPSLIGQISTGGAPISEIMDSESALRKAGAWIPGIQLFRRQVYCQAHRGYFSEMGRENEGLFKSLGFWPKQWATARMFAGTAKGFHIHPPHIPKGSEPGEWNRRFLKQKAPKVFFEKEQWDVMFFLQGRCEFFLVDEREGLPRKVMRFFAGSDANDRQDNTVIAIPPGVAHAMRVEGSTDVLMVYGTSVTFSPAYEGRLASGVEAAELPPEWADYLRASAGATDSR